MLGLVDERGRGVVTGWQGITREVWGYGGEVGGRVKVK
jgi:hypothetical protein